jgi:hypothetical protein
MRCKVCQQEKKSLSKSHLTPKSIRANKRGKNYHIKVKQPDTQLNIKKAQGSGIPIDSKIFCQNCEKMFQKLDDKFFKFKEKVIEEKNIKILQNNLSFNNTYKITLQIDYDWLDTFSASLLYRHSLSYKKDLESVELGKYQETARKMIIKYNNGQLVTSEQNIFQAFCFINTARIFSENIISYDITYYKYRGTIRVYRLLIHSGIELHIQVSNQRNLELLQLRQYNILAFPHEDSFIKKLELACYKATKN